VSEDETEAPVLTIKVCDSLSCEMAGSADLARELTQKYGSNITISQGACMGRCDQAPVVRIQNQYIPHATAQKVDAEKKTKNSGRITTDTDHLSYQEYVANGGFESLRKIFDGTLSHEDVLDQLKESGHRGLGGAGFPHALKIQSVLSVEGPRYMAVNADESEPGTFKDRHFMNSNPYQFLEGMLIGATLIDAQEIYIFLRDEYPETATILRHAIADLKIAGLTKGRQIHLRRGAGAYICGEESAMLESLEGKRAYPRHKPPFPAHVGLFGRPTLINNVETLYWFVNSAYVGRSKRGEPYIWSASNGEFRVRVVDDFGRGASRKIKVIQIR